MPTACAACRRLPSDSIQLETESLLAGARRGGLEAGLAVCMSYREILE
jgi:hypothetical protein